MFQLSQLFHSFLSWAYEVSNDFKLDPLSYPFKIDTHCLLCFNAFPSLHLNVTMAQNNHEVPMSCRPHSRCYSNFLPHSKEPPKNPSTQSSSCRTSPKRADGPSHLEKSINLMSPIGTKMSPSPTNSRPNTFHKMAKTSQELEEAIKKK